MSRDQETSENEEIINTFGAGTPPSNNSDSNSDSNTSLLDHVTNQSDTQVDGVFGNLEAKDEPAPAQDEQLPPNLHFPGEDDDLTPPDQPPTYEEASADATPSYFETTFLTDYWGDEIFVGDKPVGSLMSFFWCLLISVAFGIPGFFFTYLFHTSHASQYGSLVGLGWTLFNISFDLSEENETPPTTPPSATVPDNPAVFEDGPNTGYLVHPTGQEVMPAPVHSTNNQLSWVIFAFGILLIVKALYSYGMTYYTKCKILRRQHEIHTQTQTVEVESPPAPPVVHIVNMPEPSS